MDFIDAETVAAVRSREQLRFEFVDEQGWDASCGYAALATLLRRYRGVDVDEAALLERAGSATGTANVTLAALASLARGLGFDVRAWRARYERLPGLLTTPPVLVHYDRPRGHFALVLAAGPEGVVAADPARGVELLTRAQFLELWSGVVLEVTDSDNPAPGRQNLEEAVRKTQGRSALVERALSKPPWKR